MSDKVLVLRTNPADGTSRGGFVWPESGPVEAPDWNDRPECGGGLHGLLWGCGSAGLLYDPTDDATVWRIVEVDADSVIDLHGKVKFPRGVVVFCGDRDGALSYLDAHGASDKPVVYATRTTGGYGSTVTGGDWSTVTGGDGSTVTGGYGSTVTGGYGSTVTGGDWSTVTGGAGSVLLVAYWDGARRRIATGYIGEGGLLPNVPYRLDNKGRFVGADQ